jgi:hypothetical protein
MDLRMHEELAAVWNDVGADDDVRVVVLTGAGAKAPPARRIAPVGMVRRVSAACGGLVACLRGCIQRWGFVAGRFDA